MSHNHKCYICGAYYEVKWVGDRYIQRPLKMILSRRAGGIYISYCHSCLYLPMEVTYLLRRVRYKE